jgi:hypothetical protein
VTLTLTYPSSFILYPSSFILHPSSFILYPLSFILPPSFPTSPLTAFCNGYLSIKPVEWNKAGMNQNSQLRILEIKRKLLSEPNKQAKKH